MYISRSSGTKSWRNEFLSCNFPQNTGRDVYTRIVLFNIFAAVYIFAAVPFGIFNIVRDRFIIAAMLFAGVIIIIGTRIFLSTTKNYQIAFIVVAFTMALLLLSTYITGGINNNGPLWFFAYPVAVLSLLGPKMGAIASLSLIAISLLLCVHPFSLIMRTFYAPDFIFLHFCSYLIVFILAFSYEFQKQKDRKEIKELKGLLPLCSFCKKIRDDKGYWEQVDVYIHKYSDADITHSVCPECVKKHYPQEHAEIESRKNKE